MSAAGATEAEEDAAAAAAIIGGEAEGEDEEGEEDEVEEDSAWDSRESTDARKDDRTGSTDCAMGRRGGGKGGKKSS